jgi:hypothetical protein
VFSFSHRNLVCLKTHKMLIITESIRREHPPKASAGSGTKASLDSPEEYSGKFPGTFRECSAGKPDPELKSSRRTHPPSFQQKTKKFLANFYFEKYLSNRCAPHPQSISLYNKLKFIFSFRM